VLAGLALAGAGCGSDSDDGSPATGAENTSSQTSAKKPTGQPIVLGNIGTYSGTAASGTDYNQQILQYWAKTVNDSGGINGHPVELIIQDDASDTTKSLSEVKDLVEGKKVIGFVGNYWSRTAAASSPYLKEKGVPVVGGDSATTDPWYTNPMYFPIMSSIDKYVGIALMNVAKSESVKKLAVFRNDNGAALNGSATAVEGAAPAAGVDIVLRQTLSLASANFQPNCLAARDAGAEAIFFVADTATIARLQTSCAKVNFRPKFMAQGVQLSAQQKVPKTEVIGTQGTFPFFETSGSPALEEWGKAIADAPQDKIGNKTAIAWSSAKLVQKALEAGIPEGEAPTTAGLLKGLYSIKDETLGGLTIPLTFTEGQPNELPNCWFPFTMKDETFATPGIDPTCA
jgi:branched-chain amino acid transport system substrate-binding protein